MDDRLFRDTMGKFATGITIVSTEYNGEIMGMTVNAFMSVSLNPKLIAISIDEKARMYHTLVHAKTFGVSVLAEEQKAYSMIFARQMEKDREIPFTTLDSVPVIENALATLACTVKESVKAGDHMIFIAEVTDLQVRDGNPVLFYSGKYREIDSR